MPRLFFICLVILISGCGERKPSTLTDTGEGEGMLPSAVESVSENTIFPHPKDWALPANHGVWAAQHSDKACLQCHQPDAPEMVVAGAPPACHSCHALYPHPEDWIKKEKHGGTVVENGKGSCMGECHGVDLEGGLSKVSCDLCHSIYPHPQTWVAPHEHGKAAKGDGKIACRGCHGDDLRGGIAGVSCSRCHGQYPHPDDWKLPEKHGTDVMEHGSGSCATLCHGQDFKGGVSGVSCQSCHALYPHAWGWKEPDGHGTHVREVLLGDTKQCQACHGADLQGGISGVSCNSCHANYPHPVGWKNPAEHGIVALGVGKKNCAMAGCHGVNFEGNLSRNIPSCFQCHAEFPHLDPQWVAVGRNSGHANTFIQKTMAGDLTACSKCHGESYDRNIGGAQCTTCHTFGVTHQAGWSLGSGHGKYFSGHFTAISTDANCKNCHGDPVGFDDNQTKAGLANQSRCYACHFAYPHQSYHPATDPLPEPMIWEPVDKGCGVIDPWTHVNYLLSSPLFTTASGHRPPNTGDSTNLDAINHSCGGGSAGSCHFNGNRSFKTPDQRSLLCAGVCHNPSNPDLAPIPIRYGCEPPPPERQLPVAPVISTVSPVNGATGVRVDIIPSIIFSEAMRPETIGPTGTISLKMEGSATPVPGQTACDLNTWCQMARFQPEAPLAPSTRYQAEVTTRASDWSGTPMAANYSWNFTTGLAPDTTRPTVLATTPVKDATGVRNDSVVTVQFSEPMNEASLRAVGAFIFKRVSPSTNIGGTLSYDSATQTLTMRPSACLDPNVLYEARVTMVAKDLAGNLLAAPYIWRFRTAIASSCP